MEVIVTGMKVVLLDSNRSFQNVGLGPDSNNRPCYARAKRRTCRPLSFRRLLPLEE
jgi:hypothetical protein